MSIFYVYNKLIFHHNFSYQNFKKFQWGNTICGISTGFNRIVKYSVNTINDNINLIQLTAENDITQSLFNSDCNSKWINSTYFIMIR